MLGSMTEHTVDRFGDRHLGKALAIGLASLIVWFVCYAALIKELVADGRIAFAVIFGVSTIGLFLGIASLLQSQQSQSPRGTD